MIPVSGKVLKKIKEWFLWIFEKGSFQKYQSKKFLNILIVIKSLKSKHENITNCTMIQK